MITQPVLPLSEYAQLLLAQAIWLAVLWALSRVFFNRAVRVLTVAGG